MLSRSRRISLRHTLIRSPRRRGQEGQRHRKTDCGAPLAHLMKTPPPHGLTRRSDLHLTTLLNESALHVIWHPDLSVL